MMMAVMFVCINHFYVFNGAIIIIIWN